MRQDDEMFGQDMGLMHEVVVTGRKVGAGHQFWARLAEDESMFREVVSFVDREGLDRNEPFPFTELTIAVDYQKRFSEQLKAGDYEYIPTEIYGLSEGSFTPRFISWKGREAEEVRIKSLGQESITICLVDFGKRIDDQTAIRELKRMGMRGTVWQELLAIGAQHPNLQSQFEIVGNGSQARFGEFPSWRGMLALKSFDDGKRRVIINRSMDGFFSADTRFAAVRVPGLQ